MWKVSTGLLGLMTLMLCTWGGPTSAQGLSSEIEQRLGLRPNQGLPSDVEQRLGVRRNQSLPSDVEQHLPAPRQYRSRRHERYDPYAEWDDRPRRRRYPDYRYGRY